MGAIDQGINQFIGLALNQIGKWIDNGSSWEQIKDDLFGESDSSSSTKKESEK